MHMSVSTTVSVWVYIYIGIMYIYVVACRYKGIFVCTHKHSLFVCIPIDVCIVASNDAK